MSGPSKSKKVHDQTNVPGPKDLLLDSKGLEVKFGELQKFYSAGNPSALLEALDLCLDLHRRPPDWVLAGARKIVADRVKSGNSIGSGAHGNELRRYMDNMKHYYRWLVVNHLRKNGCKISELFAEASTLLKKYFAKGSEEAVRKSYQRVNKHMKDPEKRYLYYFPKRQIGVLTETTPPNPYLWKGNKQ